MQKKSKPKTEPGRDGFWQRFITVIGTIGMIVAALYYSVALIDRALGNGLEHEEPSTEDFIPITSLSEEQAPWIKTHWVGEDNEDLSFKPTMKTGTRLPLVKADGLGYGSIEWTPREVSKSGRVYRGEAICTEHGGMVQADAELHREPDNSLTFHVGGGRHRLILKEDPDPN